MLRLSFNLVVIKSWAAGLSVERSASRPVRRHKVAAPILRHLARDDQPPEGQPSKKPFHTGGLMRIALR